MVFRITKNERIDGYPILASIPVDEHERVILCDRGPSFHDPYVTAKYIKGRTTWMSGNYFSNRREAVHDLAKRAGFPLATSEDNGEPDP